MSKGRQAIKQTDVTKAVKALARAGVRGRVEIARDRIIVIVDNRPTIERDDERDKEWD